jgi:hypothetical protein
MFVFWNIETTYADAIRANILAGADSCGSCSRAMFLRAAFAGVNNGGIFPAEWKEKSQEYTKVASLLEQFSTQS